PGIRPVVDDVIQRFGALFVRDGEGVRPTELARGPWDPNACHGGAPAALLAHVCEQHDPSPAAFLARLTVELLRPVPLAPLRVSVRSLRPGRKVHWLEAALHDEHDTEVAHATALRVRSDDVDTSGSVHPDVRAPPAREVSTATLNDFAEGREPGYWSAVDLWLVRGSWERPGPGVAWIRLKCPVLEGVETSPFMRVAAAADFGSGVGNPVRMTEAAAINPELTIHVHRHPVGEWVCLESGAWAQPHGVGLAETRLHDEHGVIGSAMQSLLVEPISLRPPPGSRP
ncbi:MAG TPA: thioesterase family protein, partial [Acidimicrobiia bacterium]|nr:thioesterase family protein [Acidimicrobiia bacterium]